MMAISSQNIISKIHEVCLNSTLEKDIPMSVENLGFEGSMATSSPPCGDCPLPVSLDLPDSLS